MKKLFTILLAVTLAVTCFSVFASAATDSPEGAITAITGKDSSQNTLVITRKPFTGNIDDYNRILAELKQSNPNYTILDKRDIQISPANYTAPVTLELTVTGVKEGQEGYIIYTDKNGVVHKVAATVTNGKMTAVVNSTISALGVAVANKVVVDSSSSGTTSQPSTSPETSSADAAVPFVLATAALLVAAAAYSMKKIKD